MQVSIPARDSVPPAESLVRGSQSSTSVDALQVLLMLCIAGPLLLFIGFAVYRHQQLLTDAEVQLARSLSISHEHAMRVLDLSDALLQRTLEIADDGDDVVRLANRQELQARLQAMTSGKPHVRFLRVSDVNGATFASSPPAPDVAPLDAQALQWHRESPDQRMRIGPVLGDAASGRWFELSRARRGDTGAFAGVVSVGMDRAYFTRFHEQLSAEEPGLAITLFGAEGTVYSRWPPLSDGNTPERMSARGEVLSRVLAGEVSGTVRNISSLDGQRRMILFRKLGEHPLYIGTGREFGAIRGDLLRELSQLAAVAIVPVLGIVLTAWLAMRRTRDSLRAARRLETEMLARRSVEEALLQAQKMEALGRLTGGVAHDFNNALMVISGNLHLLRLGQPQLPARHVDAMRRAIDSATQLTRQLLAFSRRQALAPQILRLQEWLPPVKDLIAPTLGSQVELAVDVAADTPPLHVDPAELELALINLAVNARDAMPDGGAFGLRTFRERDADAQGAHAWVVIEASDTGAGMDAATLQRAFEPFFTTKPLGKGTGLGLAQVFALCQRAGGDVQIKSAPGDGTTVRMRFPPASAEPAASAPTDTGQVPAGLRVLLAEDNAEVAAVVRPVLEEIGCVVMHVPSADLALQKLERCHGSVDVLLSDVVMPGTLDGASLAARARVRWPRLRVLLMTGYAEHMQAISAMDLDVLPKPFTPQALVEAIARVVSSSANEANDSAPVRMDPGD